MSWKDIILPINKKKSIEIYVTDIWIEKNTAFSVHDFPDENRNRNAFP